MKLGLAASLVASSLLFVAPARAQGTANAPGAVPGSAATAPAANPTAPGSKPAAPKADRTARSKECSMQADKQGLHGKARKTFRNSCKHGRS